MAENLSSKQQEMFFNNTSDGIITIDGYQKITYINPAAENLFGLDGSSAKGNKMDVSLLSNKKNKTFNRQIMDFYKGSRDSDSVIVTYQSSVGKVYLNLIINKIKGNDDEPDGLMILAENITANKNLHKHERDCAIIFAGLITCICAYLFVWSLLEFTLHLHQTTQVYTVMIESISFILFLQIILFTSMTPGDIGIFVKISQFIKTMRNSIIIAAVACVFLLLANVALRLVGHPVKAYFIGGSIEGATTYIFTAILQEFLSRGVIQTSVKALMQIKFQKFFTVFITSLLFSLMHLPFGFTFMMGAFLLSVALGIIYEKHKNIWGCAFLHWSCGYLAMAMFF